MNDGSDEGGVEWVEDRADSSGLDEVVLGPRRSWRGSRRRGVLAALVAVVTLGAATALVLHASNGSDAPGRSARRTVTVPPSPPPLGVAPVSRRVHLTRQVGMDRQWLLYVKVPSGLLRIDLARGTTTQTSVPTETGPTQLVVTGDHALLHSTSMTYVVGPDGVAHRLSGWLADSSRLLPDDDDDAVWGVHGDTVGLVQTGSNEPYRQFELPSTLALRDAEPVDGGDLAVPGAGGVFDVSASRVIQRITTGQLIATGDDVSLVQECNAAYRCSTVRVGEEGQRKRVGPVRTATSSDPEGLISPNGRTAALQERDAFGRTSLHLINLSSGRDRDTHVAVTTSTSAQDGAVVWSPEGRYLWSVTSRGGLVVFDEHGQGEP